MQRLRMKMLSGICSGLVAAMLLTGCSGSDADQAEGADAPVTGSEKPSPELTLPPNASPRLRKAFKKAENSEAARDKAEREAVEILERYSVPSAPPEVSQSDGDTSPEQSSEPVDPSAAAGAGEQPNEADACAGEASCEPAPPDASHGEPRAQVQPPGGPIVARPIKRAVPPAVKQAMNDWAAKERIHRDNCKTVVREAARDEQLQNSDDQVATISQPICGPHSIPDRFKPWLQYLGIDEDTFVRNGI